MFAWKVWSRKSKDRETGGELSCSERVISSCLISETPRVTLVTISLATVNVRSDDSNLTTMNPLFSSFIVLSFCTFLWAIVLSVRLRYTDSDYPFGFFKLFLATNQSSISYFEQKFSQLTINVLLLYFQKPLRTHHIRTKLYSVPLSKLHYIQLQTSTNDPYSILYKMTAIYWIL